MKRYACCLLLFALPSCTKDPADDRLKGTVERAVCGEYYSISYTQSGDTAIQQLTGLGLPDGLKAPGQAIYFRINETVAPSVICNNSLLPPPGPRYIYDVTAR